MLLMLAVLYMLWDWARRPSLWQWFAGDASSGDASPAGPGAAQEGLSWAKPQAAAPGAEGKTGQGATSDGSGDHAAPPALAGPTDEDPEEQQAIEEEFQAITDRTLSIQPEEMFAYRRVLQWVASQPASVMRKRARTDLAFNDFMLSPDKYRGALVEIVLNARMVRACDMRAADGSELYEVWGFSNDSGSWLYDTIVLNLPEGMPVGARIMEQVRFVGYFFKLQGYHEAGAKPNAPPLAAPMLIGRMIWIKPNEPAKTTFNASWGLIILAGFIVLLLLQLGWLVFRPKRRKSTIQPLSRPKPGDMTMDQWLESAESGKAPLEAEPESDAEPPSPPEATQRDGNGQGASQLFPERLDDDGQAGG